MSEKNGQFKTWEEVIKNYIDDLQDNEKKAQYKDEIYVYFLLDELNLAKSSSSDEFKEVQRELKKVNKISPNSKNVNDSKKKKEQLSDLYEKFIKKGWISSLYERLQEIEKKVNFYNIWIYRTAQKNEFYPATHVAKLTHSSSGATSFTDEIAENNNNRYLSTANSKVIERDGAYANAELSKQVKFLLLEHNNKLLADEIINGNFSVFKGIVEDEKELSILFKKFQAILNPKLKSDNLAKQVYFPVTNAEVSDAENPYHLLTILKSSSLIHKIFENFFEKNAKKSIDILKKQKSKERYSRNILRYPINIVRVVTTQSQPQNVSILNGKRGGLIRLLTAQPPTWKSQLKPPVYDSSFFYAISWNRTLAENIGYLRDFLLRFERIELSYKDPKKMKWIANWVEQIIDEVFAYCASVQNLPSGWSSAEETRLKVEHQYFLDPFRTDDEFLEARKSRKWQVVVCKDFANWLNGKLRGRDKQFTPQSEHTRLWKRLMEEQLREFDESLSMEIKNRMREAV